MKNFLNSRTFRVIIWWFLWCFCGKGVIEIVAAFKMGAQWLWNTERLLINNDLERFPIVNMQQLLYCYSCEHHFSLLVSGTFYALASYRIPNPWRLVKALNSLGSSSKFWSKLLVSNVSCPKTILKSLGFGAKVIRFR